MSTGWWPEAIHEVRVPVKNEKAPHGMCFQKFPILHPHEILSYLWDEVGIVVPESEVATYWHTAWQHGEQWATSSPASDKHIPVGLHGDSARLWSQNKFEKITAIHLNIVHFRPRSVRFSRWCLFSCPTHLLFKNRTLNVVWKRLTWSLESAFEGLHPMTGVGGKPLSPHEQRCAGQPLSRSGAKWALTELRGDWEFHVQTWRPKASWQANRVCFKCPALAKSTQPGYLYWNHHGEEGGWESEEYGLTGFIAHALKDKNLCTLADYKLSSFLVPCVCHVSVGIPMRVVGDSVSSMSLSAVRSTVDPVNVSAPFNLALVYNAYAKPRTDLRSEWRVLESPLILAKRCNLWLKVCLPDTESNIW